MAFPWRDYVLRRRRLGRAGGLGLYLSIHRSSVTPSDLFSPSLVSFFPCSVEQILTAGPVLQCVGWPLCALPYASSTACTTSCRSLCGNQLFFKFIAEVLHVQRLVRILRLRYCGRFPGMLSVDGSQTALEKHKEPPRDADCRMEAMLRAPQTKIAASRPIPGDQEIRSF